MDEARPTGPEDATEAERLPATAVADARGVVTGWTRGAERLLGYRTEEIVGRPAASLVVGDLSPDAGRRAAQRRDWTGRMRLRHRDGRPVSAEVTATPLSRTGADLGWVISAAMPAPAEDHASRLRRWAYEQMPILLGCFDEDNRLTGWNAAGLHGLARPQSKMLGRRLTEIIDSPQNAMIEAEMREVLRTGEPKSIETFGHAPGEEHPHWWTTLIYALKDSDGRIRGVSLASMDTTEQYVAKQRLSLANTASSRIGTTLDTAHTAQELADLATERFADFVGVDLLVQRARDGSPPFPTVCRVAQASVLEGLPESSADIGKAHRLHESSPMYRALATSGPLLRHTTDADTRLWLANDPERSRLVEQYGVHSIMFVPMVARGTVIGLVQYARHQNPTGFDADDLDLAVEITARAALSIDNALRYTQEKDTALALQRSLLPQYSALRHSAVEAASLYIPADTRAGVGGDWFDIIPLSGARVALVVGDVVGHGIHASVTMARLRTAVRTLADVDLPPDELLTYLDDAAIRLERRDAASAGSGEDRPLPYAGETVATCLYAVYDPISRTCTMARAGHPAPALVQPGGAVSYPPLPIGPPLGVGGLPFESAELDVPDGSVIALFTDGLIDATGGARLTEALANPGAPPETLCTAVKAALPAEARADDMALLVARTRGFGTSQVAAWDVPDDPAEVARARERAADQLLEWDMDGASFATELVVSELVTNAIRYGAAPIRLRLIHDAGLICEVSDASSTAPHLRHARAFDEGGRGLLLVAQLSKRWGTRQTGSGKTIWAEQDMAR